jgi:hypothetical protein
MADGDIGAALAEGRRDAGLAEVQADARSEADATAERNGISAPPVLIALRSPRRGSEEGRQIDHAESRKPVATIPRRMSSGER